MALSKLHGVSNKSNKILLLLKSINFGGVQPMTHVHFMNSDLDYISPGWGLNSSFYIIRGIVNHSCANPFCIYDLC